LKAATQAIKSGDKATGIRILAHILKADPSNELAWLSLVSCVEDIEKVKYCLKRSLSLNPDNQTVRKALARLEKSSQVSSKAQVMVQPQGMLSPLKERVEKEEDVRTPALEEKPTFQLEKTLPVPRLKPRKQLIRKDQSKALIGGTLIVLFFSLLLLVIYVSPRLLSLDVSSPWQDIPSAITEFDASQFCQVYRCRLVGSMGSDRGLSYTYSVYNYPNSYGDISIKIELSADKTQSFSLTLEELTPVRPALQPDDLAFLYAFLASVTGHSDIEAGVRSAIEKNIALKLDQICLAEPIPMDGMNIWAGYTTKPILLISENCTS
jgi:hypothetical protein